MVTGALWKGLRLEIMQVLSEANTKSLSSKKTHTNCYIGLITNSGKTKEGWKHNKWELF